MFFQAAVWFPLDLPVLMTAELSNGKSFFIVVGQNETNLFVVGVKRNTAVSFCPPYGMIAEESFGQQAGRLCRSVFTADYCVRGESCP